MAFAGRRNRGPDGSDLEVNENRHASIADDAKLRIAPIRKCSAECDTMTMDRDSYREYTARP